MPGLLARLSGSVEFGNPEYLMVVLVAALILVFGIAIFALRLAFRPAKTHGSSYPMLGPIKFWFLAVVGLMLVAAAAARPFWLDATSTFKRGDVDVAIAIDVSASMWVKDLGGLSRLEVAVREATNLYSQDILTPGDRVALFVFGTTAVRKVHLSSDADRFIDQIGRIAPPRTLSGDAFPWDSDIAAAFEHIYSSIDNQDRFEAGEEDWAPQHRSDRLVILFTDGDFVGDREQLRRLDGALAEFQRRGLAVYPIGVGSPVGTDLGRVLLDYVPGVDYDQTLLGELEGINTRLSTEGLSMLEQRTGGRSFVIDSAGVASGPFLRRAVGDHRAITFQLVPSDDRQEVWQWVLALAVLTFVVAILFY